MVRYRRFFFRDRRPLALFPFVPFDLGLRFGRRLTALSLLRRLLCLGHGHLWSLPTTRPRALRITLRHRRARRKQYGNSSENTPVFSHLAPLLQSDKSLGNLKCTEDSGRFRPLRETVDWTDESYDEFHSEWKMEISEVRRPPF
jgi:hypothetical protein